MSTGWTSAADARQQIQRRWDRGDLLRAVLAASSTWASARLSIEGTDELATGSTDGSATGGAATSAIRGGPASAIEGAASNLVGGEVENTTKGMKANPAQLVAESTVPSLIQFPLRLKFRKPTSAEMGKRFAEVRCWIQSLSSQRYVRVEMVDTRHPQLGVNVVPRALWVDSLDDALKLIGKRTDAVRFAEMAAAASLQDERLLSWMMKRPIKALELEPGWERLLLVFRRIIDRTETPVYLRQLSVPGVDTKFIESMRGPLGEWLDTTLPDARIDQTHRGLSEFARRYGFRDKSARLRLRSLDGSRPLLAHPHTHTLREGSDLAAADVTLDLAEVRKLQPGHRRVLITENEINYLVLPALPDTLAIFGAGYGLSALGDIDWLHQRDIWYWGDLDTHGFAILDELRKRLPEVRSLMMDRRTLMKHEIFWGVESKPAHRKLGRLTQEEGELYQDIVENRYADRLRLEQEQIDYAYALARLEELQRHR